MIRPLAGHDQAEVYALLLQLGAGLQDVKDILFPVHLPHIEQDPLACLGTNEVGSLLALLGGQGRKVGSIVHDHDVALKAIGAEHLGRRLAYSPNLVAMAVKFHHQLYP